MHGYMALDREADCANTGLGCWTVPLVNRKLIGGGRLVNFEPQIEELISRG